MARIAIVGAGAKAAAIVARAAILRERGTGSVPEILVFEAEHVAAAWSGKGRFSSGFLTLCTPGEKDVGFPYDEIGRRSAIQPSFSSALFARFSWSAYLVATHNIANWVDRGRDHPTHSIWALYLEWVFSTANQSIIHATVDEVRPIDGQWEVSYVNGGTSNTVVVDGVVLTGTGRAKAVPCTPDVPPDRVFDAETFWPARESIGMLEEGTITVVGDGGAAGTVVAWLAERFAERGNVSILCVNPMGTLFPRGDGHAERRWFSDPTDWRELSIEHRRNLLARTEAGVVSLRIKRVIDSSPKIGYVRGRAIEALWNDDEIKLKIEYDKNSAPSIMTNYVINAIGFDNWSMLELVNHSSVSTLCAPAGEPQRKIVEIEMLPDLSLPPISGLPAGLHVPALAGLAHGPGISNLGCLGLLAAKVLKPYLK